MLNQTTVLIVTGLLAAFSLLVLLVCVVKNMRRSVLRGVMSLLVAIVCVPVSILIAQALGGVLVGTVLKLIDTQTLQMLTEALPSAQGAADSLVKMLLSPAFFTAVFWILWLIVGAIVGAVVRPLEEGKSILAFKNKLLGAAVGVVCGLVLVVVFLMPLGSYVGLVDDVIETGILDTTEQPMLSAEEQEAVLGIVNNPVFTFTRSMGGDWMFDLLTSSKLDGERITLSNEVGAICQLVKHGQPLVEKPMDQYGDAEFAVIEEQLPLVFERSPLLRILGAEAISGLSDAWLRGEAYLTIERPQFDNAMISIVVDSALGLFRNTTKDTLVNDIRGLTPLLSVAATATKLENGANLQDLLDALAENADTPEIKALLLTAGVGILAEQLGLYDNKEEIYDEYTAALAVLSSGELSEEELCAEIKSLNEIYAIPMSDEECAALAASLIANPYMGGASEGEPALMNPATSFPAVVPCGVTAAPAFTNLSGTDDLAAWLAKVRAGVATDKQESLAWLSGEDKKAIPTQLVTTEDLSALTTKEMAAEIGKEEMSALLTAASQIMANSGEGVDLKSTLETVSTALGGLTSTESGKALVSSLVTGVLQSDLAKETLGISASQATTIANAINENGVENLDKTVEDVNNLMNVVTHLKDGSTASDEKLSPDDFRTLLMTMNDSSASLLRSLCTPDMLKKTGLPAESTVGIAHLLDDLLDELVRARKNWSEDAYQKEADALYRVLLLATGAQNATGSTFEERIGMSAEQLIEVIQASELLTTVLPGSIDELYAENPDALGLSKRLDEGDRAHLREKIAEYKQTADEGGDALLDALARMLG